MNARERLEDARRKLAADEQRQKGLEERERALLTEIRTELACKPGEEKEAAAALRASIQERETEIDAAISEVELARNAAAQAREDVDRPRAERLKAGLQ